MSIVTCSTCARRYRAQDIDRHMAVAHGPVVHGYYGEMSRHMVGCDIAAMREPGDPGSPMIDRRTIQRGHDVAAYKLESGNSGLSTVYREPGRVTCAACIEYARGQWPPYTRPRAGRLGPRRGHPRGYIDD